MAQLAAGDRFPELTLESPGGPVELRQRGVELDCLGDPRRLAYAAVGLEKGSLREYVGPQLAKRAIQAAASGHVAGDPQGGDITQRPGTFVVGRDGRLS